VIRQGSSSCGEEKTTTASSFPYKYSRFLLGLDSWEQFRPYHQVMSNTHLDVTSAAADSTTASSPSSPVESEFFIRMKKNGYATLI
jgi:hypothetical protein